MPARIKAYWDSWESSDRCDIIVIKSSESDSTSKSSDYENMGISYPQFLSVAYNHSFTVFTGSLEAKATLRDTYHMENVIYLTPGTTRNLYVSSEKYIKLSVSSSGMVTMDYYKNGARYFYLMSSSSNPRSLYSIPDNEHNYSGYQYARWYETDSLGIWICRQWGWDCTSFADNINQGKQFWEGITFENPTDDPYYPDYDDDPDDPDGGDGNYDDTSDPVVDPDIPQDLEDHSAVASGLIKVYNPTAAQLQSLGAFLWSNTFDPTTIKKLFNDGFGAILGLSVIPVSPAVGTPTNIILGDQDSGVSASPVTAQYKSHDFGSLDILEYWGCYLDYNPYTTMELYLPYSGFVPIDPDDYMGTTMKIRYTVDVLSGEFLAIITARDLVINQILGSCAQQVPLTASDHSQYLQNWINATLSGIQTLAAINGSTWTSDDGGVSETPTKADTINSGGVFSSASSSAKSIMSMKERYKHSGGVAGAAGHMGVRYPYVIYRRARQSAPPGGNAFTGYPSNKVAMLSSLSGYTSVSAVNLAVPSATGEEAAEILALLKSGVIL